MPCLFALCVLRKYLLQNSLLHRSQYASGLKILTGVGPRPAPLAIVAESGRGNAGTGRYWAKAAGKVERSCK